ncbi:hypothetical protein SH591_04990 [Sphingomonas sp. LY54]|uniref:GTA baseplate fiber-binding domain-containing protein n=1 Tax=Sphingomonas sp. LY54 TaxID=3095343 RepID=UPI002D774422|nr:hypothetical protein [Sphingomonas sp. LY54]WRP29540.1 hypothetical protein SH591_04990 [Sphingomonas sp. LY54]
MFDAASSVDVELLNDDMWLESRSDDALVGGSNAAMLGGELIQFGSAEPLGDRRFRVSRLVRGRRGSEWAAATHAIGEPFLLLDPETLRLAEPPCRRSAVIAKPWPSAWAMMSQPRPLC